MPGIKPQHTADDTYDIPAISRWGRSSSLPSKLPARNLCLANRWSDLLSLFTLKEYDDRSNDEDR